MPLANSVESRAEVSRELVWDVALSIWLVILLTMEATLSEVALVESREPSERNNCQYQILLKGPFGPFRKIGID